MGKSKVDVKADIDNPTFTGRPKGIGLPTYKGVTGSNATIMGQSLIDITGLVAPLDGLLTYEFEAV